MGPGAAPSSRSSATTGRASTGRWPRRRRSAACRCRCTRTRWPRRWCTSSTTPTPPSPWSRTRSRSTSCSRSARAARSSATSSTTIRAGCALRRARPAQLRGSARPRPGARPRAPEFFEREVGGREPTSRSCSTPGTTGNPKGVCLTHDNLIITGRNGIEREGLGADEEVLAYLPMAWSATTCSPIRSRMSRFCVSCPEGPVLEDMREIGPTYYFAPPRVYENLLTQVTIRMEDASLLSGACSALHGRRAPRRHAHPGRRARSALRRILYALGRGWSMNRSRTRSA